jgi:hypothetical protein
MSAMMGRAVLALFFLLVATDAHASLKFEVMGGSSISVPSRLTLYQENQPKITMTAHYDTRPLTPAYYYAARLGWWDKDSAWELELIHHKIYLSNTTPEVQEFKVTFGYNLLLINRAWMFHGFVLRSGLGIVLAHAINTVRGQAFSLPADGVFSGQYALAGVGGQVSVSYPYYLTSRLFLNLETKFTAAYANIPIAQGVALTPNYAFHGLFGIGYSFW